MTLPSLSSAVAFRMPVQFEPFEHPLFPLYSIGSLLSLPNPFLLFPSPPHFLLFAPFTVNFHFAYDFGLTRIWLKPYAFCFNRAQPSGGRIGADHDRKSISGRALAACPSFPDTIKITSVANRNWSGVFCARRTQATGSQPLWGRGNGQWRNFQRVSGDASPRQFGLTRLEEPQPSRLRNGKPHKNSRRAPSGGVGLRCTIYCSAQIVWMLTSRTVATSRAHRLRRLWSTSKAHRRELDHLRQW